MHKHKVDARNRRGVHAQVPAEGEGVAAVVGGDDVEFGRALGGAGGLAGDEGGFGGVLGVEIYLGDVVGWVGMDKRRRRV